jgi:hypothetical protein
MERCEPRDKRINAIARYAAKSLIESKRNSRDLPIKILLKYLSAIEGCCFLAPLFPSFHRSLDTPTKIGAP